MPVADLVAGNEGHFALPVIDAPEITLADLVVAVRQQIDLVTRQDAVIAVIIDIDPVHDEADVASIPQHLPFFVAGYFPADVAGKAATGRTAVPVGPVPGFDFLFGRFMTLFLSVFVFPVPALMLLAIGTAGRQYQQEEDKNSFHGRYFLWV